MTYTNNSIEKAVRYTIVLLFLSFASFAQTQWPKPFEIKDNFPMTQDLPNEQVYILSTGETEIPFKKVLTPEYDKKFEVSEKQFTHLDGKSFVWARYAIKNASDAPQTFTFTITRDEEHLYIAQKGKWVHLKSGDLVPWSERDGIRHLNAIPCTLQPGEEVKVYANLGDLTFFNKVTPRIGNYAKVMDYNFKTRHIYSTDDVISFAFFGFIMFAMIFNLFFYYVNREKVYLVYSCLLFFSALLLAENVISSLVLSEYRGASQAFLIFTVALFIIMLIHTVRFFFRINVHFKGWDKFLVYFSMYIGLSAFLIYIGIAYKLIFFLIFVAIIASLSGFVFIIAAIVLIISLLRKKDKEARLFVIAAMPFMVSPLIALVTQTDWIVTVFGMWTILVLSWGMFARFKSLQMANARAALEKEEERNKLIAAQKEELETLVRERTAELTQSLADLKQTQTQLIQSEKMASLGELTAGIAHEIQNPLNFVNNFSDVSIELIAEMKEEMQKGDIDEAIAISEDIEQNLGKINHHGKRADSIVKGMLQHSRASSGQKEPTDMNALADEYLRLAYHGLRAKDKSFNADLVTNFEPSLPKADIIPQDVGRVLLNLFTNAFYATQQKQKTAGGTYKPVVTVTTIKKENIIEIRVKDNGTGIPDAIKDKILQPFFTTKPTGEGTGLGLSLSYDIIVKAHGGTINIESTEGEGSEFIITLKA